MKKFLLVIVLIVCSTNVFAQKDKSLIEASIIGFFNGLSLVNADTLRYYTTDDFELLEHGEVWNLDTLIRKVTPAKGATVTRVNSFTFITTKIYGNTAWVSYQNTANFTVGERQRQSRWLESAVLIKRNNKWNIQMLHSTRQK